MGINLQGIFWSVVTSVALLMLIVLALFLGILAFAAEMPNVGYQAIINSFMVGSAVLGTSIASLGAVCPSTRHVISAGMAKYLRDHDAGSFSFSLNEQLVKVLNRAERTHLRRASASSISKKQD